MEHCQIIENSVVPDVFVSGLHSVEDVGGGCVRLTCYTNQRSLVDGQAEKVVSLRFVVPIEAVPPAVLQVARAVGMSLVAEWTRH